MILTPTVGWPGKLTCQDGVLLQGTTTFKFEAPFLYASFWWYNEQSSDLNANTAMLMQVQNNQKKRSGLENLSLHFFATIVIHKSPRMPRWMPGNVIRGIYRNLICFVKMLKDASIPMKKMQIIMLTSLHSLTMQIRQHRFAVIVIFKTN